MRNLHPRFYSCPQVCAENDKKPFDANRSVLCDSCDIKLSDDKFRESVETMWTDRLGEKALEFRFDKILATLYQTIALENLPPSKMSVKTRSLLDCYKSEINKGEQIEEWNERQKDV